MLEFLTACSVARSLAFAGVLALASSAVGDAAAKPKSKKLFKVEEASTEMASAPTLAAPVASEGATAPARFFTINQVLAKQNSRGLGSASSRLAALDSAKTLTDAAPAAIGASRLGDEPFGLFTFRAPEGLLWQKWRRVQADINREADELLHCRAHPESCSVAAARFNAIVDAARAQRGRARYETVNRLVNSSIRYTSDFAQHGVPDLWSAPLTTLAFGRGDCEDYAIAKYVALREAGVPSSELRLMLVHDRSVRQDHSVLAARHDGHWLILDNRWTQVPRDGDVRSFTPLFAINAKGVKLFAAPYAELLIHESEMIPAADEMIEVRNYGEALAPLLL